MRVEREADLGAVYQAYLEAVDARAPEFVVDLPAAVLGLDDADVPPELVLTAPGATAPADLAVTLRAPDGLCVLAGMPVKVAARAVRLQGIAVVGGPPTAIGISAAESVVLDDVVVIGNPGDEFSSATLQVQATGPGTAASLRSVVIGDSSARDAMAGFYCSAGAWFQTLGIEGLSVSGRDADAVLGFDSVAELRLRDCALAAGTARSLLRALVAPTVAEVAGCRLSAAAGSLLQVVNADPSRPATVRLSGGTAVTLPASELPPGFEPAGVTEVAGASVDEEIAGAVATARRRVLAVDERLAGRV